MVNCGGDGGVDYCMIVEHARHSDFVTLVTDSGLSVGKRFEVEYSSG